jgi:hypothetical protein
VAPRDFLEEGVNLPLIRDVDRLRALQIGDFDHGADLAIRICDGGADAGRAPCDDGDLVVEAEEIEDAHRVILNRASGPC